MIINSVVTVLFICSVRAAPLTGTNDQTLPLTGSACLNGCLQEAPVLFSASNLRNFGKLAVGIEDYCSKHTKMTKCVAKCSDEDRSMLSERIALGDYMCKQKIEELRLVKDCIGQLHVDVVGECGRSCGAGTEFNMQIDSSPTAPVNPFAFFDGLAPVCQRLKCTMKCTIAESNKRCAGSGDIFKDIGRQQVLIAADRIQNDIANTSLSSLASHLSKVYKQSLPSDCVFIVEPSVFDEVISSKDNIVTIGSTTPGTTVPALEPSNDPEVPIGPPSASNGDENTREDPSLAQPETPVVIQSQPIPQLPTVEPSGHDVDLVTAPAQQTTSVPFMLQLNPSGLNTAMPRAAGSLAADAPLDDYPKGNASGGEPAERTIHVINDDNEVQSETAATMGSTTPLAVHEAAQHAVQQQQNNSNAMLLYTTWLLVTICALILQA